ncbi:thioredoxin family protein [Cytophagaceae bacterium ABcell3]|nr:thioredoxin family protein [Cytophagaceae bacterium ABcell3]
MKSFLSIILLLLVYVGHAQGVDVPVGKTEYKELQTFEWYELGYENYRPKKRVVNDLGNDLNQFQVLIFGGTWCPDTQKLLPHFYKVLHDAGYPLDDVSLYLLDFDKSSPEGEEENYAIKYIPTLVLMKDGEEVGRIVERVKKSVEVDLREIIRDK